MDESAVHIPEWYDPSSAATVDTGGYWIPPLAAALDERGDTTSIVVLEHKSFVPALIREFPLDVDRDQVHRCLAEAARTVGNFNLLLCCAVNEDYGAGATTALHATGPWLWVRYPHGTFNQTYAKNEHLAKAYNKSHYVALALATQLQEDFNTLQDFDCEFRHLQTLNEAMRRLKQILLTKFPEDMRRIARLHHDLSF